MTDKTRKPDFDVIDTGLKSRDPNMRRQAKIAADRILKQDSWTIHAREALLRETRNGRTKNATDIRDEMVKHEGRKGSGESVSFFFSLPESYFKEKKCQT